MTRLYRKKWIIESVSGGRVVVRWRTTRKVAYCSFTPKMVQVGGGVLMAVDEANMQWWLLRNLGPP